MKTKTCANCVRHEWETINQRQEHYCLDDYPEFDEAKINEPHDHVCWTDKKPS